MFSSLIHIVNMIISYIYMQVVDKAMRPFKDPYLPILDISFIGCRISVNCGIKFFKKLAGISLGTRLSYLLRAPTPPRWDIRNCVSTRGAVVGALSSITINTVNL